MSNFVDWYQLVATSRGVPDGWRWFQAEVKGEKPHHVFIIRGAVPNGTVSRGKYKGRPKYDKSTQREIIITPAELKEAWQAWERENGRCHECIGDGRTVTADRAGGDHEYAACRRCGGSGKPVSP